MIELIRIVEHQSTLSSYRATQNAEHAVQLELLIEMTKPRNIYQEWHPLIATPFRYNPPHPEARFRPPYGKNVFYGALLQETALYEHAFYFMKERRHLKSKTETGVRTICCVEAYNTPLTQIKNHSDFSCIMNKNDYSASHQFIIDNPKATFIIFPSCRDPEQRDNAAVLDINHLVKHPAWEATIKFFYENHKQQMHWLDYNLQIQWTQVC